MPSILIIDDEPDIRELLALRARLDGYAVQIAMDGQEGLERHRERHADLVIVNMRMPRLGGLETIAALRDELPALPIISLSADEALLQEARARGASMTFRKPFDVDAVMTTVQQLLAQSRAA